MKFAITIFATDTYTYALFSQANRVQSALKYAGISGDMQTHHIILAGDKCARLKETAAQYRRLLPGFTTHLLVLDGIYGSGKNYKGHAQLTIATGRSAMCAKARELDVDYCFSLDSDVLPAINSIRCCLDALNFDNGYYSVAMSPYPSQGIGGLLGGRGTPQNPILPNYSEDEKEVDPKLLEEKKALMEFGRLKREPKDITDALRKELDEKWKRVQEINKLIEAAPPKGDVFELNSKGRWKRRGWYDHAYPAIGLGAMMPTDWTGFGCTMMNRTALALCDWSGYGSGNPDSWGTEDIYINYRRWHQKGLRSVVIPHALSSHVCRDRNMPNKYIVVEPYHETEGECVGHVRYRLAPFYEFQPGEKFDPANDGRPSPPPKPVEPPKPATIEVGTQESHT